MTDATSSKRRPINQQFKKILRSGKYSDLTLSCGDEDFKVHKAIVCPRSPVFEAACDGYFEEAASNVIQVTRFDSETVKRMLLFVYTDTYFNSAQEGWRDSSDDEPCPREKARSPGDLESDPTLESDVQAPTENASEDEGETDEDTSAEKLESILGHVKMNAIADYYDIHILRHTANIHIQHALDTFWSVHTLTSVIQEVFSSTGDKELHKILSTSMAEHADEFMELNESVLPPDVLSDFAMSVIRHMAAASRAMEDSLRQGTRDLESLLGRTKDELFSKDSDKQSAVASKKRLEDSIGRFNDLLRRTVYCRNTNCLAEFRCHMEQIGVPDEMGFVLRCSKCNCRHAGI